MIERYTNAKMKAIWTDESKFLNFLEVELASLDALSKLGFVPYQDVVLIKAKAKVDVCRIQALEKITKHDVIAFTRSIDEFLGEEKRWFHYGLTSTDIVDSANALALKKANQIITEDIKRFLDVLQTKAMLYQHTPCIGRTHGIHAEVTSFGLKWVNWYDELKRNNQHFQNACQTVEVVKLSGAVGNYTEIPFAAEAMVAQELGLGIANISTQVLSRDRFSNYIYALAAIASTIEKIATEIRGLSRTEIKEVEEYFTGGQKGSSAMPHKRNPIASENMCGIARMVRSYVVVALEDNALWHERDISHSSCERIILPDATILVDYMLTRYRKVLDQLTVFPKQMIKNIWLTKGLVFSGQVLASLIKKGLTRAESYDMVQCAAFICNDKDVDFKEELKQSKVSKYLTASEIEDCFSIDAALRNVEKIYRRVFEHDE